MDDQKRLATELDDFRASITDCRPEGWRLFWALHEASWWLQCTTLNPEPEPFDLAASG